MKIGIIGYGSFGKLCAEVLKSYAEILIYDKKTQTDVKLTTFEAAAKSDVVILSAGLQALAEVCRDLSVYVRPQALVIEVCAVKTVSMRILKDALSGKCQLLSLHPLFGPQTAEGSTLRGKKVVFIPVELEDQVKVKQLLRDILGLNVIEITAEEHDREMAWVHGLTFFVGRGLLELDPPKSRLATGYYDKFLELVEFERGHSRELFDEVESANPYSAGVRDRLMKQLKKLDAQLKEAK